MSRTSDGWRYGTIGSTRNSVYIGRYAKIIHTTSKDGTNLLAREQLDDLNSDYNSQATVFARAFSILESAILAGVFPGASVAVAYRGKLVALSGFGRHTYHANSPEVTTETVYDLASLTKVIATTTMAMLLFERGKLNLDTPVGNVLPEFLKGDARKQQVTARMLLAHSSGLPAYVRLFETAHSRDALLGAALALPLEARPGERTSYSDVGFFCVLAELLCILTGEPLNAFCQREIFTPLAMHETAFNPPINWKSHIPPTENDIFFRRRVIQGEVHDENAYVMGGVAGHAGLFASAYNVARFAQCILNGGSPILKPATIQEFLQRQHSAVEPTRALGWDIPTPPSQSGQFFSQDSIGHLGFTGTSLWIDPHRQLSVTLLTNRTWPDRRNEEIKNVRPKFHDAVVQALESL